LGEERQPAGIGVSKVALVTGASRGIGAATARLAAKHGYKVCINYTTSAEKAEAVAADIKAEGGEAILVQADMADEDAVVGMFETIDREAGRLDALVNNAGIVGPPGPLETQTGVAIRRVLDVNLFGTIICCREAVKRMSTKNGGRGGAIVNLSSVAAREGAPKEWTPYGASKGGVSTFTLGLAREVAGEGIRVNAILPGLIETDMHAGDFAEARLERLKPTIPIGRTGTPEECAEAILWLLSDQASYVAGAVLPVTGAR
jgi:NAD(P)-dependent dehydrogenase (short-subunit alcohol dehydrogenase family)